MALGRASAAAPTDVTADNDAVMPWYLRSGAVVSQLSAAGTLITATSTSLNVNCTGGCSGGTQYTQDAALTVGTTVGTMAMGRASAAVPTDVSADGDAVIPWYLRSGALAAQPTFGGVLAVAGNGASGTGVQRVTIANDSTGILATVSTVTTLSQFAGAAINLNAGNAGTGTLRTVLATDQAALPGLGIYVEDAAETAGGNLSMAGSVRRDTAASSAGTTGDNATLNTNASGALWVSQLDPCSSEAKITDPFSLTARGVLIAAAASKKNYICAITVVAGAAEIANVVEGTGTTCQTGTAAIAGSTTAANGMSFAANGGWSSAGGNATVLAGKTANVDTCLVPSGSNRLSGFVTYVQR
jgi:hypothetical protein